MECGAELLAPSLEGSERVHNRPGASSCFEKGWRKERVVLLELLYLSEYGTRASSKLLLLQEEASEGQRRSLEDEDLLQTYGAKVEGFTLIDFILFLYVFSKG